MFRVPLVFCRGKYNLTRRPCAPIQDSPALAERVASSSACAARDLNSVILGWVVSRAPLHPVLVVHGAPNPHASKVLAASDPKKLLGELGNQVKLDDLIVGHLLEKGFTIVEEFSHSVLRENEITHLKQ